MQGGGGSSAAPYLSRFEKLWAERTILLTPSHSGAGSAGLGAFPVLVRATLMDSTLVNAGIEEFVTLASMNEEEIMHFRQSYARSHSRGDSILIWVEMQTTATEDFLQLDRWTIFLENEGGQQVEPGHVVEHSLQRQRSQFVFSGAPVGDDTQEDGGMWAPVTKQVELYFPRLLVAETHYGNEAHQGLRFVLFDVKNPNVRAEGVWAQAPADGVGKEH